MKVLLADSLPQQTIDNLTALGVQVINKPKLKAEELAGAMTMPTFLSFVPQKSMQIASRLQKIFRSSFERERG